LSSLAFSARSRNSPASSSILSNPDQSDGAEFVPEQVRILPNRVLFAKQTFAGRLLRSFFVELDRSHVPDQTAYEGEEDKGYISQISIQAIDRNL